MRNRIQFDEQLEVIDQLYDVEVREKGIIAISLFYNEEKRKSGSQVSWSRTGDDPFFQSEDYYEISKG